MLLMVSARSDIMAQALCLIDLQQNSFLGIIQTVIWWTLLIPKVSQAGSFHQNKPVQCEMSKIKMKITIIYFTSWISWKKLNTTNKGNCLSRAKHELTQTAVEIKVFGQPMTESHFWSPLSLTEGVRSLVNILLSLTPCAKTPLINLPGLFLSLWFHFFRRPQWRRLPRQPWGHIKCSVLFCAEVGQTWLLCWWHWCEEPVHTNNHYPLIYILKEQKHNCNKRN